MTQTAKSSSKAATSPNTDNSSKDEAGAATDNHKSGTNNHVPSFRQELRDNKSTCDPTLTQNQKDSIYMTQPTQEQEMAQESYDESNLLDRLFHETVDAPCRSVALCEGISIENQLDLLTVRFFCTCA
jgi:Leucine-rich repeat (LRR) protein